MRQESTLQGVFINYRTGDGEEAAALLERGLSDRFGKEWIFRATTSIKPGQPYPDRLIIAVRDSAVLLAVIGPEWAGDPRLRDAGDWVRREILEADASRITIIPVLKGRTTERLKAADLPAELERLADIQSFRLDPRDSEMDIRRIGDFLAEIVPALRKADRRAARTAGSGAVQSRHVDGDVGTVIKGNRGPVHTGKGDINQNTQHFSGGAAYIHGDNHGGISHTFGRAREDEETG